MQSKREFEIITINEVDLFKNPETVPFCSNIDDVELCLVVDPDFRLLYPHLLSPVRNYSSPVRMLGSLLYQSVVRNHPIHLIDVTLYSTLEQPSVELALYLALEDPIQQEKNVSQL